MNYDVKPDIITMAKGITSAYLPLSATAVKKKFMKRSKIAISTSIFATLIHLEEARLRVHWH